MRIGDELVGDVKAGALGASGASGLGPRENAV
jgi:hypothetical protein